MAATAIELEVLSNILTMHILSLSRDMGIWKINILITLKSA